MKKYILLSVLFAVSCSEEVSEGNTEKNYYEMMEASIQDLEEQTSKSKRIVDSIVNNSATKSNYSNEAKRIGDSLRKSVEMKSPSSNSTD